MAIPCILRNAVSLNVSIYLEYLAIVKTLYKATLSSIVAPYPHPNQDETEPPLHMRPPTHDWSHRSNTQPRKPPPTYRKATILASTLYDNPSIVLCLAFTVFVAVLSILLPSSYQHPRRMSAGRR